MAEFGWAYVAGGAITGAAGPVGSVLTKESKTQISGSGAFTYSENNKTVTLLGHLSSSGVVSASFFAGNGSNLTSLNASNISAGTLNNARMPANISVTTLTTTANITASSFFGNGANLTGLSAAGANTQIQYNNAGAFAGSNKLTFDGSKVVLTGSMIISGSLTVNELNVNVTNKEVMHVSATGSTSFGDSADDIHSFTGAISGSKLNLSGLAAGTATTSSYLALDANNNVVLTSSAGGAAVGGTIGAAEDGSYADGLFSDFTNSTTIGTAVDKFNEVLKILAPTPAPSLSRINYNNSAGTTAKLSFGASAPVADYTSSATAAGFTAVDRNGSYSATTSGNNFRLGIYDGTQAISGSLNFNTAKSVTNGYLAFSDFAFGNAETGTLKLELNGATIHSVNLASFIGTGTPNTGSGTSLTSDSGFINVSTTASSFDGNNAEWNIFKHRTAKFKIGPTNQKVGWNYARAIHTIGATDYATNYIEWINDPSGAINDLSVSDNKIEEISLVGSKKISGVEYNTDATAKYKFKINNLYRNVYAASGTPISFTVSNSSTPSSQAVPAIGGGESNTKVLSVTASLDYNGTSLLSGSITANTTVTHPFKNTITNVGATSTGNGFLIDNRTLSSTNLLERFHDESQRKQSGSFNSQGDVTGPGYDWNSSTHMTSGNGGHSDGLIFYNQRLYSPVDGDIPNGGNFSSLLNVASGQPNYSTASGVRTFYRKIQNTSDGAIKDLKITSTKNSTTYNNSTLSTANVHMFVKIPGTTGWMDVSQNFAYGNIADGNGGLISTATNDVDSGNNVHHITFGTASVADDAYLMVKVVADESWAGYISQLQFQLGASTDTASTPGVLSDINVVDSGQAAKLSFGAANVVAGYTSANGAGIGLTTFNVNSTYSITDNRRGVMSSFTTVNGELNEAIAADGNSDFPAKALGDGFTGTLSLQVNGSEVHFISLSGTLNAINSTNGNGSRLNVSSVSFSKTTDNVPNYSLPYRTGLYEIAAADQRVGWNYARIVHNRPAGALNTNYIEWIVDPSGSVNDMTSSQTTLSNFDHPSVYYQSGVRYFASKPSASFSFLAGNAYRNVYSNDATAISFPTLNQSTITNIRLSGSGVATTGSITINPGSTPVAPLAVLNNTAKCHEKPLQVTGTVLFSQATSLVGNASFVTGISGHTVAAQGQIAHPLKNNITTSIESKTNFLVFSGSIGSTNQFTEEYFNKESFRLVSGSYNTSASIIAGTWSSENSMNNGASYAAYNDGMLVFNSFLISPLKGGNNGDFRNTTDGGIMQSPAGNVNYSTGVLSSSTRTFYRYFENNTSNDRSSITITLYGSGSLVNKSTALGNNGNFYLEAKIPGNTAWLDAGKAYTSNNKDIDGSGALVGNSSPSPIGTGGTAFSCTFNGGSLRGTVSGPDRVVLKISAHKDWLGYLTRLKVAYS